jgi:hypothetical protein
MPRDETGCVDFLGVTPFFLNCFFYGGFFFPFFRLSFVFLFSRGRSFLAFPPSQVHGHLDHVLFSWSLILATD